MENIEEKKETSWEIIPKISTWVQVVAIIALGIVQVALNITKPEMVILATFSMLTLFILALVIIWADRKTRADLTKTKIDLAKIKADSEYQLLLAKKKGADEALDDAIKSFRQDARSSKTAKEKSTYLDAAKLVSRQKRLLKKMQERAKMP